ncbi:MAG TPA: hypothetical protein VEF04_11140 [Blastocatellia bacterium]|nr:hypothetical protein [Blastocatellia bacterium]
MIDAQTKFYRLRAVINRFSGSLLFLACVVGMTVALFPTVFLKLSVFGAFTPIRFDILLTKIALAITSYLMAALILVIVVGKRGKIFAGLGVAVLGTFINGGMVVSVYGPARFTKEIIYFDGGVAILCMVTLLLLDVLQRWYRERDKIPSIILGNHKHIQHCSGLPTEPK